MLLGLLNRLQMEEGVEPLAHDLALSPLDGDLVLGEGSQKNEESDGVADGPVGPDLGDACLHGAGEIVLLNIEQVASGVSEGKQGRVHKDALAVVKAVNNSLVLLPFVCLHFSDFSLDLIIILYSSHPILIIIH